MREGLRPAATRDRLALGDSDLTADADALTVTLDTPRTRFFGRPSRDRLRGRIVLHPAFVDGAPVPLATGHAWFPVAPCARVEVELQTPALRFSGTGYHDANTGDAPLEHAFERWQWLRWGDRDGARVRYAGLRADGTSFDHGLDWDRAGRRHEASPVPWNASASSRWGIRRDVPADLCRDPETAPRLRTLLDAPFYNRTLVESPTGIRAIHESVDLVRFRTRWVRALLGFRTHTESGR